jgi:hypothetical protein
MTHDRPHGETAQPAPGSVGTAPVQPTGGDPRLRTDVPHSARVYDYWLGGKDNFAADRLLAERIEQAVPEVPAMARANRAFMRRRGVLADQAERLLVLRRDRSSIQNSRQSSTRLPKRATSIGVSR